MKMYPLILTDETINDYDLKDYEVCYRKVGSKVRHVALIPVSDEVYDDLMRSFWREEKREQRHSHYSMERARDEYGYEEESQEISPEERLIEKEIVADVRSCIALLNNLDRKIIEAYMEGLTERQIAEEVGVSQKTVNNHKKKIFGILRKNLTQIGY